MSVSFSRLALLYFNDAKDEEGNDGQNHQHHHNEDDLVLDNPSADATNDPRTFAHLAVCLAQLQRGGK